MELQNGATLFATCFSLFLLVLDSNSAFSILLQILYLACHNQSWNISIWSYDAFRQFLFLSMIVNKANFESENSCIFHILDCQLAYGCVSDQEVYDLNPPTPIINNEIKNLHGYREDCRLIFYFNPLCLKEKEGYYKVVLCSPFCGTFEERNVRIFEDELYFFCSFC